MLIRKISVLGLLLMMAFASISNVKTDVNSKSNPLILDKYLQGKWTVEYIVRDPRGIIIPSYVSSRSFKQSFKKLHRGFRVVVEVHLNPVNLRNPHEFDLEQLPEIFQEKILLQRLESIKYTHNALREILGWVERVAPYASDPNADQHWEAVLNRGSGNCVGRTSLIKEIGGYLNINVNVVSGVLWSENESTFHRWIETTYPDGSNFPSEPGLTQDFVDPYHLVLSVKKGLGHSVSKISELDVSIQKVKENKNVWVTDVKPVNNVLKNALNRRQMQSVRYFGAVTGKIRTHVNGRIDILLKTDSTKPLSTQPDRNGNFSFFGLPTCSYELIVRPDWTHASFAKGSLRKGELKHHPFRIGGS